MTISYEEARELVRQETAPGWSVGTYCLDDREIVENDEMYTFRVGAREHLIEGNISYATPGGVPVVYKETGVLAWLASSEVGMDETLINRPNPEPTVEV